VVKIPFGVFSSSRLYGILSARSVTHGTAITSELDSQQFMKIEMGN